MKTRIGKFEVVTTQTLLIPDGNDAWVEFKVLDWVVKLHFILEDSPEISDKSGFTFIGKEDHGEFTLRNWDSELGMAFSEPVEFGETNDRNVSLMAFGHKVGNVSKLELQVYLEVQDEQ